MRVTNVLGESREATFPWPGSPEHHLCPFCSSPQIEACANPGCTANPGTSIETARAWRARTDKAAAEQAERDRIAKIRWRHR